MVEKGFVWVVRGDSIFPSYEHVRKGDVHTGAWAHLLANNKVLSSWKFLLIILRRNGG